MHVISTTIPEEIEAKPWQSQPPRFWSRVLEAGGRGKTEFGPASWKREENQGKTRAGPTAPALVLRPGSEGDGGEREWARNMGRGKGAEDCVLGKLQKAGGEEKTNGRRWCVGGERMVDTEMWWSVFEAGAKPGFTVAKLDGSKKWLQLHC